MAVGTVRVQGYRETMRALRQVEKGAEQAWKDAFKEAAQPLVSDIRNRLTRYQGLSLGTIGPRVVQSGLFVTQRKRKVTGRRGDFGALQMRVGFLPALEENEDEVVEAVEDALDKLTRRHGF